MIQYRFVSDYVCYGIMLCLRYCSLCVFLCMPRKMTRLLSRMCMDLPTVDKVENAARDLWDTGDYLVFCCKDILLASSWVGELTLDGFSGCSVPALPPELSFPPHFLKIVVEVQVTCPPHILKLLLGVNKGMLSVNYF